MKSRRVSLAKVLSLLVVAGLLCAIQAPPALAVVTVQDNVAQDPTAVPPPVYPRKTPTTHYITLEAKEVIAELAPGKNYFFWTFTRPGEKATVPGPMIRVMEGDTIVLTLVNNIVNVEPHNIDFHSAMGPGGGAAVTNVAPGQSKTFRFKAMRAGAYIYHCAGEGLPWEHVAHGMYGLIMVEPKGGLPPVDKEFYVGQSDWYLAASAHSDPKVAGGGISFFNLNEDKALAEHPDFFTFNGNTQALRTIFTNMVTMQGNKARIFFVTGGPNIGSNFHIIGQIFDKVYTGSPSTFTLNEETQYVAPGSASVFEMSTLVPGQYLLVDHALWRVPKGAAGVLHVTPTVPPTPDNPNGSWPLDIFSPPAF